MGLVPFLAEKMNLKLPVGMSEEDVLQYGYLGLVEAAARFESGQYKFSTFASKRIRGAILDGFHTFQRFSTRRMNGRVPTVCSLAEWMEHEEEEPDLSFIEFTENFLEQDKLQKAVSRLSKEEQKVLYLYYVHDYSLRRIACESNLCRNRIFSIRRSALSKLKAYLTKA